jgi:hypothetical protein
MSSSTSKSTRSPVVASADDKLRVRRILIGVLSSRPTQAAVWEFAAPIFVLTTVVAAVPVTGLCASGEAITPSRRFFGTNLIALTCISGPLTATNQPGFSLPGFQYCLTVNATQYSVGL